MVAESKFGLTFGRLEFIQIFSQIPFTVFASSNAQNLFL